MPPTVAAGVNVPVDEVYVERPVDGLDWLDEVAALGRRAKVRCGGSSVPSVAELAAFVRRCRELGVPFKATAGPAPPRRGPWPARVPQPARGGDVRRRGAGARGGGPGGVRARRRPVRVAGARGRRSGDRARAAGRLRLVRQLLRRRARRGPRGARAPVSGFGPDNLPYGVFSLDDGSRRIGTRLGDEVVDLSHLGGELAASDPERAHGGGAAGVGGDARAGPRRVGARRRGDAPARIGPAAPAVRGRRLRRLLLVARARDEHGASVPARLRSAAPELAPAAGRLPRPGRHGRRQRHAGPAAVGTGQAAGRGRRRCSVRRSGSTSSSSSGSSIGAGSTLGEPVPTSGFRDHVFGVVLVNDWSARDIQAWEYQPLGPFLGKSFATSIGAWVTPLDALEPFRVAGPEQEPPPLPYLAADEPWNLDIELEVELNGEVVSRTNSRHLYWSMPQQLAHLTANGASRAHGRPVRVGDDLGAGAGLGGEPARALAGRALPRGRRRGGAAGRGGRPRRPRRGPRDGAPGRRELVAQSH